MPTASFFALGAATGFFSAVGLGAAALDLTDVDPGLAGAGVDATFNIINGFLPILGLGTGGAAVAAVAVGSSTLFIVTCTHHDHAYDDWRNTSMRCNITLPAFTNTRSSTSTLILSSACSDVAGVGGRPSGASFFWTSKMSGCSAR